MNKKSVMVIVRGLPGSGKSTFATSVACEVYPGSMRQGMISGVFETDKFFIDSQTGEYKFERDMCEYAHNWNVAEVYRFCRDYPEVPCIVANTFTTEQEIKPYRNIANIFNRKVIVVSMQTSHQNVHGVPPEIIEKMKDRWELVDEDYVIYDDSQVESAIEELARKITNRRKKNI